MSILLTLILSLRLLIAPWIGVAMAAPMPATNHQHPAPVSVPADWVMVESAWLRVHAAPADQRAADRMVTAGSRQIPELSARLGLSVGGPVEVYLAPTAAAFRSMQPGSPPDWADGTAWPRQGLVFLRSPAIRPGTAEPLEQVLLHELAHILVGRAFNGEPPPRWLQEGVALHVAGEMGPDRMALLMRQFPSALLRFEALAEGFPDDPLTAQLAYAQSGDLIGMIAAEHGDAAVGRLVRELAAGEPMPVALRRVTGESPVTLEERWRARWTDPWQKLPSAAELLLYMGGIGAMGVAILRMTQRKRRILARWEVEEERERHWQEQRREQIRQNRERARRYRSGFSDDDLMRYQVFQ